MVIMEGCEIVKKLVFAVDFIVPEFHHEIQHVQRRHSVYVRSRQAYRFEIHVIRGDEIAIPFGRRKIPAGKSAYASR